MTKAILGFGLFFVSTLCYAQGQFEYMYVDYDVRADFMTEANRLGAEGWELTSCVTSASQSYRTSIHNPGSLSSSGTFHLARTSYCIFKRAK